jgi:hypothetical protein
MRSVHKLLLLLAVTLLAAAPVVADEAVLPAAELAAPMSVATVGLGDLDLAPAPFTATGCSASFNCGDGNTISCTGTSSCATYAYAVPNHIKCDGQKHYCPNMCYVQTFCPPAIPGNINYIQCASNVGNCSQTSSSVTCDGATFQCGMRGGPD